MPFVSGICTGKGFEEEGELEEIAASKNFLCMNDLLRSLEACEEVHLICGTKELKQLNI